MLAVRQQPHKMGSTQPESDPSLPFGYTLDPNQEPVFEAPEPPLGAPLLSETDTKFLSSFFEDMTANQYNMPSYGDGLNFSDAWLALPPQFMGSATSFGQQADALSAANLSTGTHRGTTPSQMMPPPSSQKSQPQPQYPPDDVLNAAATLLQNGSTGQASSRYYDAPSSRRPPPVGHLRHQALEEFKEESHRGMRDDEHNYTITEWMCEPQSTRAPSRSALSADFQWGSDSNFSRVQAYRPAPTKDTAESMSQEQLKWLGWCLEPRNSAENTAPSTPGEAKGSDGQNRLSLAVPKGPEDADAPPRKRRKNKIAQPASNAGEGGEQEEEEDDDEGDDDEREEGAAAKQSRQKKSCERNQAVSSSPTDATSGGKRRKSAATVSKPPRENLSEEQKRENHIKSEQRRRTLIKEGFDDLCELVPGLGGGGFSKSTMLSMAANWLEDILRGNEVLAAQLSSLEKRR